MVLCLYADLLPSGAVSLKEQLVPFCPVGQGLPVQISEFVLRVIVVGLSYLFCHLSLLSSPGVLLSSQRIPWQRVCILFSYTGVAFQSPFLFLSLNRCSTIQAPAGNNVNSFCSLLRGDGEFSDLSQSLGGLSCASSTWVGSSQPAGLTRSTPDPPRASPYVVTVMCFANLLDFSRRVAHHLSPSHRRSSRLFIHFGHHIIEVSIIHRVSYPGPCLR